ncbi:MULTISPECIES: helix-turn-helix domain-containing protein [Geobacillus]|uniref:helix-turn-helix domain-containing protein n=1 Tax=Geobacillus TaxID=129337 RepID=UPI0011AEB3B8|nr:helix-turn-helix domain-containing protein [Geobacillus kaustophilus]
MTVPGSGYEEDSGKYYLSIGNKESVNILCKMLIDDINTLVGMQRKTEKILSILEYFRNHEIPKYKRLSLDEVKLIKQLLNQGISMAEIARKVGCSTSAIYSIKIGRTHKNITI